MENKIKKPIFIIGTGRNGSSLLHDVFSYHQNVLWTSLFHEKKISNIKQIQLFFKLISVPPFSNILRKKYPPSEAYNLWDFFYKGFRNPYRDLRGEDLLPFTKARVNQYWSNFITPQRSRVLFKITGWPRILFLKELFPDAKFIHLVRDGRAVSASFLKVKFWNGWRGPEEWRHGVLPPEYYNEWIESGGSFVALAGINWKLLVEATCNSARHLLACNYLEIKYEDFVDNKIEVFSKILEFCELDFHDTLRKNILKRNIKNMNYKWKEDLTIQQQDILNKSLKNLLVKFNYI